MKLMRRKIEAAKHGGEHVENGIVHFLPTMHKNKTSLKLRNLLLHNDCVKKLKSISITRSSLVNNSINFVENKNIKTTNLDKIESNNYTTVKKLF